MPGPGATPPDPREAHQARLAARLAVRDGLDAWDARIAAGRLAVFVVGAVMAWQVLDGRRLHLAWLAVPAVAFLALVIAHDGVIRRRDRSRRAVAHHEGCLERLEGRWAGRGEPGERHRDPGHPCAEDLDLFGRGSLYELLCTCRTTAGEDALAALLAGPAIATVVRRRQEAVKDMAGRLDLREDLAVEGVAVRSGVRMADLVGWVSAAPAEGRPPGRGGAVAFAAATTAAIALWGAGGAGTWLPLALALVETSYFLAHRRWVEGILAAIERPARELRLLGLVLDRLEREPVEAPLLRELLGDLRATDGDPPSVALARLARHVERLDWAKNAFFAPVAALLLWRLHLALSVEAWRRRHAADIPRWLAAMGSLEALAALGAYAFEHPRQPYPEIADDGPRLDASGIAHPLLPEGSRVGNDVSLGPAQALLLVSGSNMSGKSTLLRAIGANAVLAMAGAPVAAERLAMSPLYVGATLHVQDSLQAGQSRFYAEISRIRLVLGACGGDFPVLFLLDEILHGTNSHDRRIGAEAIVRAFVARGAVGLVTTHDLALAAIADDLDGKARNVHLEDRLVDGKMIFDYRLRPGIVEHSNALDLMRAVGLPV